MSKVDPVLLEDATLRKETPIFSGVLNYFPLALAAVARVSKRGNDQHNPGQPLHWARGKSTDHEDCIARHLIDVETVNPQTGEYDHAAAMAWRALAKLQELEEERLGQGHSRGSRETLIFRKMYEGIPIKEPAPQAHPGDYFDRYVAEQMESPTFAAAYNAPLDPPDFDPTVRGSSRGRRM